MRTIKFRGKKLTNGVWAYGSLVYLDENGAAIYVQTDNGSAKVMDLVYVDPIPYASSPASSIRTARRFMRATCCGQTNILIAASEIKRVTTILV